MTWPLNGSEAGCDFCCVNQVVVMLITLNLHEKSREVCDRARSPAASLAFIGQVTKHTTVK